MLCSKITLNIIMLTVRYQMFIYIYIHRYIYIYMRVCSRVSTRVLSYQLFWKMQRPFLWRRLPIYVSLSHDWLSFCYWVFSECSYLQSLSTTRYSLSDEISFYSITFRILYKSESWVNEILIVRKGGNIWIKTLKKMESFITRS